MHLLKKYFLSPFCCCDALQFKLKTLFLSRRHLTSFFSYCEHNSTASFICPLAELIWDYIEMKKNIQSVLVHLFLFFNVLFCFRTSFSCFRMSFSALSRFVPRPVVPLSWDNDGTSVPLSWKVALSRPIGNASFNSNQLSKWANKCSLLLLLRSEETNKARFILSRLMDQFRRYIYLCCIVNGKIVLVFYCTF